jgi:hypothetical protein
MERGEGLLIFCSTTSRGLTSTLGAEFPCRNLLVTIPSTTHTKPYHMYILFFIYHYLSDLGKEPGLLSGIALGYGLGRGIFLLTTASRPILGATQPHIQRIPEALSLGVKWPGREADRSPPSIAEVKNTWSYTSTPPIRLHGLVLS